MRLGRISLPLVLFLSLLALAPPVDAARPARTLKPIASASVSAPSPAAGTVTVVATATARKLARIEVYLDGGLKTTCTVTPCNYSWNTLSSPNGSHVLAAKRYENGAPTITSPPFTVVVSNDQTPPTVSLSAPAVASGTVTLSALASDASGVSTTQIFVDGALVASSAGSTISHSWNTMAVPNGTHTVQAKATDSLGNLGFSGVASLTVSNTTASFDYSLTAYGPHSVVQGYPVFVGLRSKVTVGTTQAHPYVSAQNLPPGTSASFPDLAKTCCRDSSGQPYSWSVNFNTAVEIRTSTSTPPGSYDVILKADVGGVVRSLTYRITVLPPPASAQISASYLPPIPQLALWETHMLTHGQTLCDQETIESLGTWEGNVWYYDGQRVYFQIADYTGDSAWEICARYVRNVYRDQYVLPNNGAVPGYRIFPHGLKEDYFRTGDTLSRDAALLLQANAAYSKPSTPLASVIDSNVSREVAYNIMSYLVAEELGAPRHPNLTNYVEVALGHIDQWAVSESALVRPFMVGLTLEALIRYHAVSGDPRVLPAVKTALDWVWDHTWVSSAEAFLYTTEIPAGGVGQPSPDLNLLIAPAFAWLYRHTGDVIYQERGDLAFAGGVLGAWLGNGKQFSQNYRWSFDYVMWRTGGGISD